MACLATITFGLLIMTLSVFSYMPFWASSLLISLFLILVFLAFKPWQSEFFLNMRHIYLIICLIGLVILAWVVAWLSKDVCVASSPNQVSFYFNRRNQGDLCSKTLPKPCHTYITFNTNASTSAIVHFHSSKRYTTPVVHYGFTSALGSKTTSVSVLKVDIEVDRWVYYAVLDNLLPSQTYMFRPGDDADPASFGDIKKFRTAPVQGDFSFITGGDMGTNSKAPRLIKAASKLEPLYISIGGDLAYANGMKSCYPRWDEFLTNYDKNAITPLGYTLPIVASVGNHEAGGFAATLNRLTFYTRYFVQETLGLKKPQELPTHHVHYISNQVMIALDSNVVETPQSQVDWLTSVLKTAPANSFTSAMYHAPGYPSVRVYSDPESRLVRQHFVPVFDKYNLTIGLENHDHAYKRTGRLRNNARDPTGTLYIGDGAFGVSARIPYGVNTIKRSHWYLDRLEGRSFFVHIKVNATAFEMNSYDENGTTFDKYVQSFAP